VLGDELPSPAFSALLGTFATLLGAFTVLSLTSILATP